MSFAENSPMRLVAKSPKIGEGPSGFSLNGHPVLSGDKIELKVGSEWVATEAAVDSRGRLSLTASLPTGPLVLKGAAATKLPARRMGAK